MLVQTMSQLTRRRHTKSTSSGLTEDEFSGRGLAASDLHANHPTVQEQPDTVDPNGQVCTVARQMVAMEVTVTT